MYSIKSEAVIIASRGSNHKVILKEPCNKDAEKHQEGVYDVKVEEELRIKLDITDMLLNDLVRIKTEHVIEVTPYYI